MVRMIRATASGEFYAGNKAQFDGFSKGAEY
jgi:hypothetical protein